MNGKKKLFLELITKECPNSFGLQIHSPEVDEIGHCTIEDHESLKTCKKCWKKALKQKYKE